MREFVSESEEAERAAEEAERDANFERVMAENERVMAENKRIRAENEAECERIRAEIERLRARVEAMVEAEAGAACRYMAILGLVAGYTARELKIAYKRASLRTHPDKGGSDAAFRATNEAYEYLKA